MAADAVQASLNGRFTYHADKGESWRIMRDQGPVTGDCEDYSLTLIWLYEGRSMLRFWWALITFRYVLWFCLSPSGDGHAVVWCRGRGWTDNIQRRLVSRGDLKAMGYRLRIPYLVPLVALKFLLRPLLRRI
ncbi:hypothetical protein [Antarcticimicrobium sediminis]|uniref:Uncharacterized protein n=1 Tax=Antarcticimicrobium sediminis TaxID=2546227 RepID=A0A4R5EFL4_9RHOB|nr:hypothetical protein [Antarcticimicrobium sediminis]TDE33179.1 hypothetical protein E1B25_21545 [Antarcticimicrobium sediminis]